MAMFSGSAADMLKKYGKDVPDQEPQSSLAEAQAAKKKMDAEATCTDEGCTEDHTHGHSHGHGETCTEDHGHGGHDHKKSDHAHGHEHGEGCCGDHAEKSGGGHGHGHGHTEAEEKAEASHGEAVKPEEPKKDKVAFTGCARGKYDWAGTEGGKTAAADGALGTVITDYAFGDGPKKASVYVDLAGLDDVEDEAMCVSKLTSTKIQFGVTIKGDFRTLTLSPLLEPISAAKFIRKPGKDRVVLKLTKEEPKPWAKLLGSTGTGFDEEEAPGGGGPGGMGDLASMMGGMGGGGGGGMAGMAEMMAKMKASGQMPGASGLPGADLPADEEDDLDDLPDLEEDNVD